MARTKRTKIQLLVTYEIAYQTSQEKKDMVRECKDLIKQNANWKGIATVTNVVDKGDLPKKYVIPKRIRDLGPVIQTRF